MSETAHGIKRRWLPAAGFLAVVLFGLLVARFWHPYYGFTKFVQLDEADARSGIHEVRANPVFVYDGFNGYDGAAYAQIAFHPLLDSPELQPALGNVPYRARRILGSALAWALAAGDPAHIAGIYAGLNVGVWLVFAGLLWRVLPVVDSRSGLAWLAVMFSAGALHSVRLALTDLLAALLVVLALWLGERGRPRIGTGVLALAGLARETALAAVVGLWRPSKDVQANWRTNVARTVAVAMPLLAWIGYVRWRAGPAAQGFGNFTWPLIGWVEKWIEAAHEIAGPVEFRWLAITTLLAVAGLTVQAAFLLRYRKRTSPWWRAGFAGVAMMALLGTSVWEGHPGAATRVLLPMTAVFAVFAVRTRASAWWLVGGALTTFSGVLALWHVPQSVRELSAGYCRGGAYVAQIGEGWFGVERDGHHAWAWTGGAARLEIRLSPGAQRQTEVALKLRAMSPRHVEIRSGGSALWSGGLGEKIATISLAPSADDNGRIQLEIASHAAPTRENDHPDARALGLAIYGVSVR